MGPLIQCRALNPRSRADTPSVGLFPSQLKRVTDHRSRFRLLGGVDDVKRFAVQRTGVRIKKGTATRSIQHAIPCACVCMVRLSLSTPEA
jgi:hypothetical protein